MFELDESRKELVKLGEVKDWPDDAHIEYFPDRVGMSLNPIPGLAVSGQDISWFKTGGANAWREVFGLGDVALGNWGTHRIERC